MSEALTIAELENTQRLDLGASDWVEITQERIDLFAEATGDHQWIHVDAERAANGPFGTTIAHGYLLLALLPTLLADIFTVSDQTMGVNYGIERLRFTSAVAAGSRVRARAEISSVQRRGDALAFQVGVSLEIDGSEKPALVGEVVYLAYGGS